MEGTRIFNDVSSSIFACKAKNGITISLEWSIKKEMT